jgi:hypothetical protein
MMCGLICRALGAWMMVSFVAGMNPAEAQRENVSTANLIFQPDAYDGERGASVSGAASVATNGGVLTPQFFLMAQQPFGIKPWQQFNACLALPSSSGAFRFDLAYESLESFRSYQFGISYAHRLHQAWYAGLGFRFQQMRTTGYPQKAEPGYELAILWNPIPDLAFSSSLLGFSSGKGSSIQQSWWPQEFRAGCFFRFSRSLLGLLILHLPGRESAQPGIAIRYQPDPKVSVRLGMSTGPPGYFFGLGYQWGPIRFEVWMGLHSYLGGYPGMALRWEKTAMAEKSEKIE